MFWQFLGLGLLFLDMLGEIHQEETLQGGGGGHLLYIIKLFTLFLVEFHIASLF